MSVAAVLATMQFCSHYFYVGSADVQGRDRDGIGIVLDGKEMSMYQSNPWEVLAVSARQEIALLFNHSRYTDAYEKTVTLSKVTDNDMKPFYKALADMIEGYAAWDRFDCKNAQRLLNKAFQELKTYSAGRDDPIRSTLTLLEKHCQFIQDLQQPTANGSQLDFLDLLANSDRRAGNAKKYDDAVARLYSALEGLARNRLKYEYHIQNHKVAPHEIPANEREEFMRQFSDPNTPAEPLRLPLEASFLLLAALKDELGLKYKEKEEDLKRVLFARNQSRLAHGETPVKQETFENLRKILVLFSGVDEQE